jgi:hypothetical protein
MGTPSRKELEILLSRPIETIDEYELALQQAEALQQAGIIESFVETIPKEVEAQVAIYANPTLTNEQKIQQIQDLEFLRSSGQMSTFGGLEDRIVPPGEGLVGGVTAPITAESRFQGLFDPIIESLRRQQDIGEFRTQLEQPTIVDARESLRKNLTQHFQSIPDTDRNSMINASLLMFDQIRANNPNMSQTEVHDETVKQLNSLFLDEIKYITPEEAEKLDPRTRERFRGGDFGDMFANAYDYQKKTGTALPLFTDEQLVFLENQQNDKYRAKIGENESKLRTDETEQRRLQNKRMAVITVKPGDYEYMPTEVYLYLKNNPLGGIVYDADRDTEIIKAIQEGRVRVKDQNNEFVERDISGNRRALNAIARVRAYDDLGNPDWTQTLNKRKSVLENIEYYDEAGIFEDKTALGGTTETSLSWVLRSAFSPLAVTATIGTEALNYMGGGAVGLGAEALEQVGALPELPEGESYLDPEYTRRIRERERPELYQGYGLIGEVADNIARFKGFTGEGVAIANEMNLDGLAYWGTVGGYFIMDLADPSFDVATGTIQGTAALNRSIQAQRRIHQAANYNEALKAAKSAALEEIPLVKHSLKMYEKYTGKKSPIKDLHKGDVVLSMKDNVARNLNAERMAKQGATIDDITEAGLGDTNYAQLLKQSADTSPEMAQQYASGQFRKLLMENPETAKMLKSYDETVDVVRRSIEQPEFKPEQFGQGFETIRGNPLDELQKIKRQMSKTKNLVDFNGAKLAIKTAQNLGGDLATNALKNVDQLYATPLFLRVAPDVKAFKNISWISRNTLVHSSRVPRIMALASQTDVGKAFGKITAGNLEDIPLIAAQRPAREIPFDIFQTGKKALQAETEAAFDLSKLSSKELDNLAVKLRDLEIAPTRLQQIESNILDNKVLFRDDYNMIMSQNRDLVARFDKGAVKIEDLDRVTDRVSARLLEARGTVGRTVDNLTGEDGVLKSMMSRQSYKSRKQMIESISSPTLPSQTSLSFEQSRLMSEFNREMGTFSIRSEELFERLTRNDANILDSYLDNVPTQKLKPLEVMGLMIVGEKQTNSVGRAAQNDSVMQSTEYMINNLFIAKGKIPNNKFSQADKMIGLDEVYKTNIWNGHGQLYLEQKLEKLSKISTVNPLEYWKQVKSLIDDLNDAIQNPSNRLRKVEIKTEKGTEIVEEPIVPDYYDKNNVLKVNDEVLQKQMGTLSLATYYAAESERVLSRLLLTNLQTDLTKLSVNDLLPNVEVSQKSFESLVKAATLQIYKQGDTTAGELQDIIRVSQLEKADIGIDVNNLEQSARKILRKEVDQFDKINKAAVKKATKEYNKESAKRLSDLKTRLNTEHKAIFEQTKARISRETEMLRDQAKFALRQERKQIPVAKRQSEAAKKITEPIEKEIKQLRKKIKNAKAVKATTDAAKTKQQQLVRDLERAIFDKQKLKSNRLKALKSKEGDDAVYSTQMKEAINRASKELNDYIKESKLFVEREKQQLGEAFETAVKNEEATIDAQKPEPFVAFTEEQFENTVKRQPGEGIDDYLNRLRTTGSETFNKIADKADSVARLADSEEKILMAAEEQARIVLRNNNLTDNSQGTVTSMQEAIDDLFKNENYAKAIFGADTYEKLKTTFSSGAADYKKVIMQAVIQDPESFKYIKKTLQVINQSLYVSLLGWRVASHVRNTITAPTIVYQTTGELLSTKDISRGFQVVKYGQSITSKNYGKVILRTKDGMVYTNGDIFKILQKSGVRNQFQFIQSSLRDGSDFVKDLNRMRGNHLSDFAYNFIRSSRKWVVEKPLYLQTQEDFIFRAGILTKALEDGRSVEEAASLSRRSMFDYSDMPPEFNKAARTALVFSSFTYQNIVNGFKALRQPTALKRYARMLRTVQSTNTLLRGFNDDKQLPYQMYYPVFAQNRVVFEINTYNDRTSFLMGPPIPAIDSVEAIASLAIGAFKGVQFLGGKEVNPLLPLINLIQPLYKEMLPFERKYESSLAKPELVTFLSLINGATTPTERAELLEEFAGGRVMPRPAKPNDKNAIDGYVYPLSKVQRKKLYHQSLYVPLVLTGLQAQIMDHVRLFSPEGTTQANQTFLTRLGAYSGLYALSQANPANVQQERNIKLMIRKLEQIKKGSETMTEAAIFRDTELIQPSEE